MTLKSERAEFEAQVGLLVAAIPKSVRAAMIADRDFVEDTGLEVFSTLQSDIGYAMKSTEFVRVLREVAAGSEKVTFTTSTGETVDATTTVSEGGSARIGTPKGELVQPSVGILAEDKHQRLNALTEWTRRVLLPAERIEYWKARLGNGVLSTQDYMAFCKEAETTPEALHDGLQGPQTLTAGRLVPVEDEYLGCLLPPPAEDFAQWRDVALHDWKKDLLGRASRWRLSRVGYSTVCKAALPEGFVEAVDGDALDALCSQQDPFSLVLALEIIATRAAIDADGIVRGKQLIERLIGESAESKGRVTLFGAAVVVAYAGLQKSVRWRMAPLYWRRMAVLAQAGVLTNALLHNVREYEGFREWAFRECGATFFWGTVCDRREAPRWGINQIEEKVVRGCLIEHVFNIVMAVPQERRPDQWVAAMDRVTEELKTSGEWVVATLAGPLEDFEGYTPPFNREQFAATLEDLGKIVPAAEMRGLKLFVNGLALTQDDLAKMAAYVQGMEGGSTEELEAMSSVLVDMGDAAAMFRHVDLANAVGDKAISLFAKRDESGHQLLLGTIMSASNAREAEDAAFGWAAKFFEKLAYSADSKGELMNLQLITKKVVCTRPQARAYFAATDAIVEMRAPHLAKKSGIGSERRP